MRPLAALAAVLVLAGCGTVAGRSGAPAGPAEPLAAAPPLEAADEAPPGEAQRLLDELFAPLPADFGKQSSGSGGSVQFDYAWGTGPSGTQTAAPATPEQLSQLRADLEAERAAIRPADGSAPRLVARLPLGGGGTALLLAWHTRAGLLCTATQLALTGGGGGGGGPSGPCERAAFAAADGPPALAPHCAAICLASNGSGSSESDMHYVLSGTVAAGADALRVTTADGAAATYPLAGPVLPGGDRRVFMLDLGSQDWRTLTLLRGGEVVDEIALPALTVAVEECSAKLGPMPHPVAPPAPGPLQPTPELQAHAASMNECLHASGALPPGP